MNRLIILLIVLICYGNSLRAQEIEYSRPVNTPESCTSILVGKKASADGSVMTSHTCDGNYRTWMEIVPAARYERDTTVAIYNGRMHTEYPADRTNMELKGTIPEARSTYQFLNTSYPCLNEKTVGYRRNDHLRRKSCKTRKGMFMIEELEKRCGKRVIGNKSASGTEIIEELGEEEINTGAMIVYTSADSVMQICGNEETFDLANLYRCCEIARELTMKDEWRVGRVIARPYVGKKKGEFKRTSNRHDYALKPTGRTALNALKDAGYDVISVGKIFDIFDGEGLTESNKSKSSVHGMEQTIEICKRDFRGLCFVNLVDFDALWGHRRNVEGYGKEIEKFDKNLGVLLEEMRENDLLILTADHGNDPTYTGTDHTREYVPFIAYSKRMKNGGAIKDEDTFAVIGASVAENFGVPMPEGTIGHSVLKELM